ncbi:MAG: M18 family aminopeptidase [Methylococcaceae bacterium]|nr:M18 family aminopeptidase [Methylococcaceae bacterium]
MAISVEARAAALDLIDFIDASPSPWHAVASVEKRLLDRGYRNLPESERWRLEAGGRYLVVRGGSIVAFALGTVPLEQSGFRIVGAHTDSPGLRLKPRAAHGAEGLVRLAVEVYGGPILATFTDRDLSLAGRVNVRASEGIATRLLQLREPLVRLPNLAIHMNRNVNEDGLKLNKQTELPLIFGVARDGEDADARFRGVLADALQVEAKDVVNWELAVYDTQQGRLWGAEQEFVSDSQLDNLASCHAGVTALLNTLAPSATCVCALFDHEEVGSESAAGAGGSLVADLLGRIAAGLGCDGEGLRCALARSFFVSADMAHAWHPNFPAAYEPNHRVLVNAGPVIKTNANQRYSTGADTAARFIELCEMAGVRYQHYAHRSDLGCGSTIGPIVASRLGVPSVDVGSPMWAMHSLRESAGVADHAAMIAVLSEFYRHD